MTTVFEALGVKEVLTNEQVAVMSKRLATEEGYNRSDVIMDIAKAYGVADNKDAIGAITLAFLLAQAHEATMIYVKQMSAMKALLASSPDFPLLSKPKGDSP